MKNVIIEDRDLAPQWLEGGSNLGRYTVKTKRYNGVGLLEFMQEDAMHADAIADIVAGQVHIKFGSKMGQKLAMAGADAKAKDETDEDWRTRVYDAVKAKAKEVLPGATLDYVAETRRWIVESFAKRGQAKDKREVLTDFYKITGNIEKGWADGSDEKKTALVKKLGLAEELAAGSTAEVLAAIGAKYKPEKVEVKEDDLF